MSLRLELAGRTPEAKILGGFATFLAALLLREQAGRCFPCIGVRGMPRTQHLHSF